MLLKLGAQAIQTGLPHGAIAGQPGIQIQKGLWTKGIETTLTVGTHLHYPSLVKNAKVARNARLFDVDALDQVTHGALPLTERLHHTEAGRVGKGLEYQRVHVYILSCI